MKYCEHMCKKLSMLMNILTLKFDSKGRRASYELYELSLLYYRSMAFQIIAFLYTTILWMWGISEWQVTDDLLSDDNLDAANVPFSLEAAESISAFAKYSNILLNIGRIPLILLSIKKPRVCKVFLSYEILAILMSECMVTDVDRGAQNIIMLLMFLIIFYMLHYDFWTTFISTILSQGVNIIIQTLLYEASLHDAFLLFFLNTICLIPLLLICHGVVTATGFLFVDADQAKKGNE